MKIFHSLAIDLVILGVCFYFFQTFIPYQSTISYNPDEGLELIKSHLLDRGYSLYSEIWSDQPPGYTFLLSLWSHIFGATVRDARFLTILLSLLLLLCFRRIIAAHLGNIVSIYAVMVLFFSENYIKLSVSVMQAVPSLATSLLSLYILISLERGGISLRLFLALISGFLAGWAIVLKLWVLAFLPVSNIYLLTRDLKSPFQVREIINEVRGKLLSLEFVAFNLGWISVSVYILFVLDSFDYQQLIDVHFGEIINENMNVLYLLSPLFNHDKLILILALASALAFAVDLLRKQKSNLTENYLKLLSIPLVWLFTALLLFWNHRPLWFHYYPLFIIPLIWISCYFPLWLAQNLSEFIQKIVRKSEGIAIHKTSLQTSISIGLLIVFLYGLKGDTISYINGKAKYWDREPKRFPAIIKAIEEYPVRGKNIYTNQPILAVYTNSLIPPEIAVLGKQIRMDNYVRGYNDRVLAAFQKYEIEQIILVDAAQLPIDKELQAYIKTHYQLLGERDNILHYKKK